MGIMSSREAMDIAIEREVDLVKIAPTAQPPVCRLMDYGKFRYEQAQKEKEQRRNQHIVEIKEIRLSATIDAHDFNFKLKNALKFLKEGHKVKVSVRFYGREIAHPALGEKQLLKFAEGCDELSVIEKTPKLEGRRMFMFLAPKAVKPVAKAAKDADKAEKENADKEKE
jgi:translation initiation factor IF-3